MSDMIKRATGLLVIEVVNSNPNGDPDRESDPRQRPNGCGEISPVSFKRKLRDLLDDHDSPFFKALPEKYSLNPDNYFILEHRGRDRNSITAEMGKDPSKFMESEFVRKYWDARVFGNTFLEEKGKNKSDDSEAGGKEKVNKKEFIKTGVVQFGMGVSIAPVDILRQTNTNKAGVQEGKNAGMAPLAYRIVEHGVYCMPFFVNPNYAHKSGCTVDDIELLKLLIPYAYELNRSAIRPDVRLRHAWYIEHKNMLGSCPEHLLFEALTPGKLGAKTAPSTAWSDYQDKTGLPEELRSRVENCIDLVNP
ncbi:MAG: type I CRISPR-associated protein Cas7 [Sporolactobacillus sp.]